MADVVFLGWSHCARLLRDKLGARDAARRRLLVVSEHPPEADAHVAVLTGDFSSPEVHREIDWTGVMLAVVFCEPEVRGDGPSEADARSVMAAMQIPSHVERVVVEVRDKQYIPFLRDKLGTRVEIMTKESADANVIAHAILNEPSTTSLLFELAGMTGGGVSARRVADLVEEPGGLTAGDLRRTLLRQDTDPVVLLGLWDATKQALTINPPLDQRLEADDIVFCVAGTPSAGLG